MFVVAVVPILPVLFPLVLVLSWAVVFALTLFGISGTSEQRRMFRRFLWNQRYSLAVILGIFGFAWYGIGQAIAHWNVMPTVPTPLISGTDWPMFQGGPTRTGSVPGTSEIAGNERVWSGGYQDRFYASPVVTGNRVYAIGTRENEGRVFCWDLLRGELQWVFRPEGMRAAFSSPILVGNRLLCGEGLHSTTNARIFCLDVSQASRPTLEWSFETRGHIEGTPIAVNDRVFVPAGDDGIYALSLNQVSSGRPAKLWHFDGDRAPDVETGILADQRYVYAGLGQGGQAVLILEADSGNEVFRIPFEFPVHAPPALEDERLYVGMGAGDFVNPRKQGGGGAVACIDLESRSVVWSYSTPATVLGAISLSDDEVVFGCADGQVRVLSKQGELRRSWDSGASIVASLSVTSRAICGINARGRLFVLDRSNLMVLWERFLGSTGYFISSPVLAHGQLFVGTEQYGFQCFGQPVREHR